MVEWGLAARPAAAADSHHRIQLDPALLRNGYCNAGGRSAPSAGRDGDTGSDCGPGQPRLTVVESQLLTDLRHERAESGGFAR
jgi:hypothetical protein